MRQKDNAHKRNLPVRTFLQEVWCLGLMTMYVDSRASGAEAYPAQRGSGTTGTGCERTRTKTDGDPQAL